MGIGDLFQTRFEDWYTNPDWVALVWAVLVFVLAFTSLDKFVFKKNRAVNVVIALCVSLIFLAYFRNLTEWIATFNITVIIVVIAIAVAIGIPFIRFIRRNWAR